MWCWGDNNMHRMYCVHIPVAFWLQDHSAQQVVGWRNICLRSKYQLERKSARSMCMRACLCETSAAVFVISLDAASVLTHAGFGRVPTNWIPVLPWSIRYPPTISCSSKEREPMGPQKLPPTECKRVGFGHKVTTGANGLPYSPGFRPFHFFYRRWS